MFELEEYSSGFHDGFLNKYAVSLEKTPNLFILLCFCFNCLCRRRPPTPDRFPPHPYPTSLCVGSSSLICRFLLDFYSIILQKEDEQEIHVCMYSKNICTCVCVCVRIFARVFFLLSFIEKEEEKLSRILNSVTARLHFIFLTFIHIFTTF